jgi:predicted dehydrogenase/nucleoside-diphosphate-sugar epimerase
MARIWDVKFLHGKRNSLSEMKQNGMSSQTGSPMKVAVVGCGRIAEYHLRFLSAKSDVHVVGVVDVNPAAAQAMADKHSVSSVYTSLEEMLRTERPDVVHVTTPPAFHFQQAITALRSGAHVLLEKPVALSLEHTSEIYKTAEENGLTVCPDFIQLFYPTMQRAAALIESGALGKVVHCEANQTFDINLREVREAVGLHWSYELPCGIFHNYITHPLYMVLRWVGKPNNVIVSPRSLGSLPQQLTDHLDILLEGERISAHVVVSFVARPRAYYLRIFCERGTVLIDFDTVMMTVERPSRLPRAVSRVSGSLGMAAHLCTSTFQNIANTARRKLVPYHGLRTLIDQYYEAIRAGRELPVSKELALAVAEAEEAVQMRGGKLHLDLSPRPSHQEKVTRQERILLTGGTGHLGAELARQLVDAGFPVRAYVRPLSRTDELEALGVAITYGDIRDAAAVEQAASGISAIIHVAAALKGSKTFIVDSCVQGVRNIAGAAARNGVERVIYISSLSVYDYNSIHNGETVSSTSPLDGRSERRGISSMAKRNAEEIALSHLDDPGCRWTILRPAGFFGNGHKLPVALGIKVGRTLISLGSGGKRLRLIHVRDVAAAIIKVLESPTTTQSRIFTLAHQDKLRYEEYVKDCLRKSAMGKIRIVKVPYWVARFGAFGLRLLRRITGKGPSLNIEQLRYLYSSTEVDNKSFREATGWTCSAGIVEQLSSELYNHPLT